MCRCSVRVHWSFGSPGRLLCLCQHLVEMTPQTSRSSQIRPRGGDGSRAEEAHRHPEVERRSTDPPLLTSYTITCLQRVCVKRFNLIHMGYSSASESLEMSASTRERTVTLLMDMSAPPVCVRQFECVGLCVYQDCALYRNPQVKYQSSRQV